MSRVLVFGGLVAALANLSSKVHFSLSEQEEFDAIMAPLKEVAAEEKAAHEKFEAMVAEGAEALQGVETDPQPGDANAELATVGAGEPNDIPADAAAADNAKESAAS